MVKSLGDSPTMQSKRQETNASVLITLGGLNLCIIRVAFPLVTPHCATSCDAYASAINHRRRLRTLAPRHRGAFNIHQALTLSSASPSPCVRPCSSRC